MDSKLIIIGVALATFFFYLFINKLRKSQRLATAAERLGCQPLQILHHRLPGAVDLIYELFDADRQKVLPQYLQERFARADATTFGHIFLDTTDIFTIDPQNLQAMLSTQFQDFCLGPTRRDSFVPFLGHGIFTEDGEVWERSRAMLRPHFSRTQISDLTLEETHVQNLIKVLPVDDSGWTAPVDLQILFFRFTLDLATEFLFGRSVNSQIMSPNRVATVSSSDGAIDGVRFGKAFDICSSYLAKRARMGDFYWLFNNKEFTENCKESHRFVDHFVDVALKRDKSTQKNRTFLHSLLEQTSDRVEIRSELINLLLAGRDTTAGFLGWLFYILVRHQDIQSKLRSIILEVFGPYSHPKEITLTSLRECKYLQYCLHETLRLYPPVPVNFRQAVRDTTLPRGGGPDGTGKVFVPEGTSVNYTVYALHRRKDIWGEDADEFRPERWVERKFGWEYLPFNGGPRVCLGRE